MYSLCLVWWVFLYIKSFIYKKFNKILYLKMVCIKYVWKPSSLYHFIFRSLGLWRPNCMFRKISKWPCSLTKILGMWPNNFAMWPVINLGHAHTVTVPLHIFVCSSLARLQQHLFQRYRALQPLQSWSEQFYATCVNVYSEAKWTLVFQTFYCFPRTPKKI